LHFSHLFSFNAPSTSVIYTLSLHDALPICESSSKPLQSSRVWFHPANSRSESAKARSSGLRWRRISLDFICLRRSQCAESPEYWRRRPLASLLLSSTSSLFDLNTFARHAV